MADDAGKFDPASNSASVYREPPPSLGMVAHIWAGHVASQDSDPVELSELRANGMTALGGDGTPEGAAQRNPTPARD